jgi:hypothetical protein
MPYKNTFMPGGSSLRYKMAIDVADKVGAVELSKILRYYHGVGINPLYRFLVSVLKRRMTWDVPFSITQQIPMAPRLDGITEASLNSGLVLKKRRTDVAGYGLPVKIRRNIPILPSAGVGSVYLGRYAIRSAIRMAWRNLGKSDVYNMHNTKKVTGWVDKDGKPRFRVTNFRIKGIKDKIDERGFAVVTKEPNVAAIVTDVSKMWRAKFFIGGENKKIVVSTILDDRTLVTVNVTGELIENGRLGFIHSYSHPESYQHKLHQSEKEMELLEWTMPQQLATFMSDNWALILSPNNFPWFDIMRVRFWKNGSISVRSKRSPDNHVTVGNWSTVNSRGYCLNAKLFDCLARGGEEFFSNHTATTLSTFEVAVTKFVRHLSVQTRRLHVWRGKKDPLGEVLPQLLAVFKTVLSAKPRRQYTKTLKSIDAEIKKYKNKNKLSEILNASELLRPYCRSTCKVDVSVPPDNDRYRHHKLLIGKIINRKVKVSPYKVRKGRPGPDGHHLPVCGSTPGGNRVPGAVINHGPVSPNNTIIKPTSPEPSRQEPTRVSHGGLLQGLGGMSGGLLGGGMAGLSGLQNGGLCGIGGQNSNRQDKRPW